MDCTSKGFANLSESSRDRVRVDGDVGKALPRIK